MATGSKTWDPAKKAAWKARYYSDPEVKKRKAAQMRRYSAPNHPLRSHHIARWKVQRALKTGALKKERCRECGAADAHAHHVDYDRPLDVTWLCRPCHKAEHAKAGVR